MTAGHCKRARWWQSCGYIPLGPGFSSITISPDVQRQQPWNESISPPNTGFLSHVRSLGYHAWHSQRCPWIRPRIDTSRVIFPRFANFEASPCAVGTSRQTSLTRLRRSRHFDTPSLLCPFTTFLFHGPYSWRLPTTSPSSQSSKSITSILSLRVASQRLFPASCMGGFLSSPSSGQLSRLSPIACLECGRCTVSLPYKSGLPIIRMPDTTRVLSTPVGGPSNA